VTKVRRIAWVGLAVAGLAAPSAANWTPYTAPPYTRPLEVVDIPIAVLVDVNSGRALLDQQPDQRFAPASMAKVMTVFVALEAIAAGRLSPKQIYTVPAATARQWNGAGTSLYLEGGQRIDVDTLLRGIATVSANDAAVVLAESYAGDVPRWCALMNAQARRLGMTNSHFATPNGWPDGGRTYVSARDLVRLAEALVTRHPAAYRRYFGQKRMTFAGVEQQSHDPAVGVVRGADGIKTGHTTEAGYNFLGSAERGGQRLIMVIGGAKTDGQRAVASRALLEWGFAQWTARPLFARGKTIARARVQDGAQGTVPLIADRAIATIARRDSLGGRPTVTLRYQGPLVAPIAEGAQVAELEVRMGNDPMQRFPLYAAVAVDKAGQLDRLLNGIIGLIS
jgi:D-alanyl-D-alanine carboxypeptidase (penicillin-binding protein 5/6)